MRDLLNLNRLDHRLGQVERERRRRGVRDWPPVVEISFATDAELEQLARLCEPAEGGVESARASVRVIVGRVNARSCVVDEGSKS